MKTVSEKDLINLLLETGLLKKVLRTGWILKGVENAESVADHSWRVAILALILAPQLKVDQLKLVKMALIHDLGEALIGDIKWERGKRVIGSQEEKHKDERKAIKKMFADNPSFKEYVDLWGEFTEQKTREAKIMKELDKLEMVIQALEYEQENYPAEWFNEFWENAEKYLADQGLESYFHYLQDKKKTAKDKKLKKIPLSDFCFCQKGSGNGKNDLKKSFDGYHRDYGNDLKNDYSDYHDHATG